MYMYLQDFFPFFFITVQQLRFTYPNNRLIAFLTFRGKVEFIVLLTVEKTSFLYEAHADQLVATSWICTDEVVGTPALSHGRYKWTSENNITFLSQYIMTNIWTQIYLLFINITNTANTN